MKSDLKSTLEHIISVSELGRGQASKIVQTVEESKEPYIVMKNNKPQVMIISIDEYLELQDIKENFELLKLASKRVSESREDSYISFEDVMKDLDIENLEDIEDSVEIE
ncbi:MAG: type II toxin-antitoxin system Phd/YefM family antitoxin [Clostridia bacterium]|nr:type II toxin-antitoxin system Phd/YefM family antitoxin [Clostridia bacterium]